MGPRAGNRDPDRLNRDFTYLHITSGCVHVASIVDVYAQHIIGWHAQTSCGVELVRVPLRLAL